MSQFYRHLQGEDDIVVNARKLIDHILLFEAMTSNVQQRTRKSLSLFVGALLIPTLAVLLIAAITVIANSYFVPIAIVYLAAIVVTEEQNRIRRLLSFFVVALFLSVLAVHATATITIATLVVHAIVTISVAKEYAIVAATSVTIAAYCVPLMTTGLAIKIITCLAYIVLIMEISIMVFMQYVLDNPSLSNASRRVNPKAKQNLRRENPEGGKHLRLWNFSRAKQILLALTEELMSWRRGNAEVPLYFELLKQHISRSNS